MGKIIHDLLGMKFGRLLVTEKDNELKRGKWKCVCDCGSLVSVAGTALRKSHTRSCGCLHPDVMSIVKTTHGDSYSELYSTWAGMHSRCGRKGKYEQVITCDEWSKYEPFKEWAISNGFEPGLTLDRKNPNLGYTPDNCRWATYQQQVRNCRKRRGGTSVFKGVSKAHGKWVAAVRDNERQVRLGLFKTELAAALAYDAAAYEIDPVFFRINFPERFNARRVIDNDPVTKGIP